MAAAAAAAAAAVADLSNSVPESTEAVELNSGSDGDNMITLQSVVFAKWPARRTREKVLVKLAKVGVTDIAGLRKGLEPPTAECMVNKMLCASRARPFGEKTVKALLLLLDGKAMPPSLPEDDATVNGVGICVGGRNVFPT